MPDNTTTSGASAETEALRSGQDWAAWLRQAHPARPSGAPGHPHGESLPAALAALTHLARRHGYAVEHADPEGREGPASQPGRRIPIRADTPPGQAVIELAHQLGHLLLHRPTAPSGSGSGCTISCGGARKVEADSVAYLAAAYLGIDTMPITFPYVSSWAGTDPRAHPAATIQAATARILAAAATITDCLDAELSPGRTLRRPAVSTTREPPRGRSSPATALPQVPDHDVIQVNMAALAFFQNNMPRSWVPGYLTARGFSTSIQRRWQAGHAPASWDALTRHLRALGFPDTLLEAAGVARRSRRGTLSDTFRNRATLPLRSAEGTVIAFIGRAPDPPGRGVPKYLNSPQTTLYDKSQTLFGLWEAREALAAGARPVITEGPLDAIAVTTAGHGHFAGVAPCGTALTPGHAGVLSRAAGLTATGVLVAFDPDPPGRRAAVRAYHLLTQVTAETSAVILPPGQDPAQILTTNGPEALAAILASSTHPLADLVTDTELEQWTRWLDHAEGRLGALRAAAALVAAMPGTHVARQVARLSGRLALDYATVTDAVTSALPAVITGPPPTPADGPRGRDRGAAGPRAGANLSRLVTPAGTADAGGGKAAAQKDPPSRPAGRAAGQDFPASTTGALRQAATTPPPAQPSPRTRAPLRRRRLPG